MKTISDDESAEDPYSESVTVKCGLQALQLVAKSISSRPGGKRMLSPNPTIEASHNRRFRTSAGINTHEAEKEPEHSGG